VRSFRALFLLVLRFELGDESALEANLLRSFSLLGPRRRQDCLDSLHVCFAALAFYNHPLQAAAEQVRPAQGAQAGLGLCGQDHGFRLGARGRIARVGNH
jgi:hypothetical protein